MPRVRVFIKAEKRTVNQSPNNQPSVASATNWSVRQWRLRRAHSPDQASARIDRYIMLTMEEAMRQSTMRFAAGEIVKGTVIEVRPKEVLVDIGYKSEGVIAGNEFDDINTVKVGDE